MPTNITATNSISAGSGAFTSSDVTFAVDSFVYNSPDETITAASSGTLSTRTDDDEGILTVSTHPFSGGDVVAIFWAGGSRYGVDIDSTTTDTITFSGGAGDNLPLVTTAITISIPLEYDIGVDGTNVRALGIDATTRVATVFMTSTDTVIYAIDASDFSWYDGNGYDNPITGSVLAKLHIYNAETTAGSANILIAYDND